MIRCTEAGCMASVSWLANSTDRALANFAIQRGWKVVESSGWRCPHHQSKDPANV